ncbi:DUF262 domain-containing protein [Nocardioides agariphilus]|uniref:DUF262 domain-containing protein n=1 Tax=Nocardioides agariphilus TaxID=433664 RepID=A0A930VHA5_9ACTN|nr:DUF262 domain-containing protein [Nocardioides agariphilus]MBF4766608.1 DUF262 domain-containing protein [Nocardioides agariphilus]
MIKSANQHPVFSLMSPQSNVLYKVPPYQREYSWQRAQWEALFDDLIEAEGAHFLGTIICLDQSVDALEATVFEVIDGQQRLTTLTLLMAAIHSILNEQVSDLDEDVKIDLVNLRRQIVRKGDTAPRLTPQRQGSNYNDFLYVLGQAGLPVDGSWTGYLSLRKIYKCFHHFKAEILELAETRDTSPVEAALDVLAAVNKAIIVKIEVASHSDAFVLFESLNNRGMPLTPVDLIKNHLLAQSERKQVMTVEDAFKLWNQMLTSLGDSYANQERFLRHYYNAFKLDLPQVPNAPVATKASLIRIYEALVSHDVENFMDDLLPASAAYGRITGVLDEEQPLDKAFAQLNRAQAAPSFVLLLWLLRRRDTLVIGDPQLERVASHLVDFFVRRNLTGFPQTYALPRLFMDMITALEGGQYQGDDVPAAVLNRLRQASSTEQVFRERLLGPVYEENSDVARFVLATLAEDAMTKESWQDLWRRERGHYVWTIEHVLPQGQNLPAGWIEMLGGSEAAVAVQGEHVHRLGNLTITGYNSTLSNKSFGEKKHRKDSFGRPIGYANGLSLNAYLMETETWTAEQIEERTVLLADQVASRFALA